MIGDLVDQAADIECAPVYLTLFPNFHPWGSFNRIVYRFRPYGDDPDKSIMECMYLAPIPADGKHPTALPIHWLGPDDDWVEAPELGMLAKVFNQDSRNLPFVQQGLHATRRWRSSSSPSTTRRSCGTFTSCWTSGSAGPESSSPAARVQRSRLPASRSTSLGASWKTVRPIALVWPASATSVCAVT